MPNVGVGIPAFKGDLYSVCYVMCGTKNNRRLGREKCILVDGGSQES